MASAIGIAALPFEIMIVIIEYAHPSSHFPLAQTCKAIYRRMASVMERHRTAHAKYGTVSDLVPSTIPDILDMVFGRDDVWHTIDTWHIRCLEFFGTRSQWDDWKPWEVDQLNGLVPVTLEPSPSSDCSDPQFSEALASGSDFRLGEDRIEHFLREAKKRGIVAKASFNNARSATLCGSDAALKVILISVLPNLKALKYIDADTAFAMNVVWLCRSVEWALESGTWPPGLLSLQRLAIGVSLFDGESSMGTSVLVRLLQLPNLVEIYLRNMRIDGDDLDYEDADSDLDDADFFAGDSHDLDNDESCRAQRMRSRLSLPVHSSSIKHIILDDLIDHAGTGTFMRALLKTPKKLESITIRALEEPLSKASELVRILSQYQSASLQRLLIYMQHVDLCSGDTFAYKPSDLEGLSSLKVLNIKWRDIAIDARHSAAEVREPITPETFVSYFSEAFPSTMSILVIYGGCSDGHVNSGEQDETKYLDEAVVALIESGRYPYLEVIYLDNVELSAPHPMSNARFQRAVAVGRQHGIHVHTITNTQWPQSHNNYFASMPNIQEIRMVPGHDPNWVFNHSNGRDGVYRPCYGCGKCAICRTVYSSTAWQQIMDDRPN